MPYMIMDTENDRHTNDGYAHEGTLKMGAALMAH